MNGVENYTSRLRCRPVSINLGITSTAQSGWESCSIETLTFHLVVSPHWVHAVRKHLAHLLIYNILERSPVLPNENSYSSLAMCIFRPLRQHIPHCSTDRDYMGTGSMMS